MLFRSFEPTFGLVFETAFVKLKSACWALISTEPLSSSVFAVPFPWGESESGWSAFETSAALVVIPEANTFAKKVTEAEPFTAILGMVAVNVPETFVKLAELINCRPAGKTSFTSTFVAVFGPAFETVIV